MVFNKPCLTRKTLDDLQSRIVDLHKAGKIYKVISIYKWRQFIAVATLPRNGHSAKRTPNAQRRMISKLEKKTIVKGYGLKGTV